MAEATYSHCKMDRPLMLRGTTEAFFDHLEGYDML